tara:strand:+ start:1541 stop:4978 length:3438 start_codon:yes stop_codon:yes gene_type:complete
MTVITLPSGMDVDFEDASQEDIEKSLTLMQQEQPELFTEPKMSERDFIRSLSIEEVRDYQRQKEGLLEEQQFKTTHEGEVKDFGLSYFVGRGDNDEERLLRLMQVFGKDGVIKVGPDDFVLQLDNITEELKEKFNLPETGTIRFNEKGLGWQDVWSWLGRETVPLLAAVGASVAASGVATVPGIALVGLAGAAGKAVDEFIFEDIFEGLQRQSLEEILKDVALQGLIEAGGEGVGRGMGALVRYATKGKGPLPDSVRVQELRDRLIAQGYGNRKANSVARKAASEEASALYRKMIEGGANIPAVTVTGKSILGRTQAIWESIFPNDVAVAKNVDFVRKILADEKLGKISTDEAKEAIGQTADSMVAQLKETMANPKQAVKQANKELKDVLEKEFDSIAKVLEESTAGSQGLASEFQHGLNLAVNLFTARSNQLYRNADVALKGEVIDAGPLISQLKAIRGDVLSGGEKLQGGIWKYIDDAEGVGIPISDIPALRAALRASESDPSLLGTSAGLNIRKMLDTIDQGLKRKEIALTEQLTSLEKTGAKFGATARDPATKKFVSEANIERSREGLNLLVSANKHYAEGADIINSGFVKGLNSQIKEKNIQDLSGIVDLVVREKQPALLKFVLDSVKPSGKEVNKIIEAGKNNPGVFRELAEQIKQGDITGVNQRLNDLGLSSSSLEKAGIKADKFMLTVPEVFKKVAKDDPMRVRLQDDFAEVLKLYDDMSVAAASPSQFREGFRSLLANTWLKKSTSLNRSDSGINYNALASSFDNLGPQVQKELFGQQAGEFKKVMNDLKILDRTSAAKLDEFSGTLFNQDAKTILNTFKEVIRQSEQEGKDAFLRAVAGGTLDTDKLVSNVLKNPKNFKILRERLGDEALGLTDDAPLGNFRDLIMSKILAPAFPTGAVTDDIVKSGSWGDAILKNMKDLNKGGALETVLGKETLDNLRQVAKAGETISDSVMRGKTGLAAAGYSAGFATALIMEPISTITGAAGILALSRALRTKPIMKYLTSPRLRAYETERAMKVGADLSGFGRRNIAAERARESALRSLRTILVDAGYYASDQGSNVAQQRVVDPVVREITEKGSAPEENQGLRRPAIPSSDRYTPSNFNPQLIPRDSSVTSAEALRQQEINKLLGVQPTQ